MTDRDDASPRHIRDSALGCVLPAGRADDSKASGASRPPRDRPTPAVLLSALVVLGIVILVLGAALTMR